MRTHLTRMLILLMGTVQLLPVTAQDFANYPIPYFTDTKRAEKVRKTRDFVDSLFRSFVREEQIPGLAYGVMIDGKLIYSGGIGTARLESGIPVSDHTLFRIASMSKSFTATAILQLRDAGKLSLDDPVSKYLPVMNTVAYPTSDSPEITIRHLLTHGAGFPEDNPWGDRQLDDTDEALMQMIRSGISFSHTPGVAYEYSNLGFAILGQVVRKVSGMDFREYTRKNILEPLGMDHTVWEFSAAPQEDLALGYDVVDGAYVQIPLLHHGAFGAMGGLITSIEDFSKYVAFHLSAWPPHSDPDNGPLKRSSLREMHHPWRVRNIDEGFHFQERQCAVVTAYCYGLRWMEDCEGRRFIGHSGGLPGFGSNWTMMPDYGLAVFSFDNRTYEGTSSINTMILDSIIRREGLEPRTLPPSRILEQRKKELIGILPDWKGAKESGIFAENFFLDTRLKDLQKQSRALFREAGSITGYGPVQPYNWLRGTFLIYGTHKNILIFFTLTPESNPKIQEFNIEIRNK